MMGILGHVTMIKATYHMDLPNSFGGGKSGALINEVVENA